MKSKTNEVAKQFNRLKAVIVGHQQKAYHTFTETPTIHKSFKKFPAQYPVCIGKMLPVKKTCLKITSFYGISKYTDVG